MLAFDAELEILLRAPYAYLYLVTHDEARAVAMVTAGARATDRPVVEWSPTQGEGGLAAFLDQIEADAEPRVYILKDPHPELLEPRIIRRLREMEPLMAAFGRSLVIVSPIEVSIPELATDLTVLHMPLPPREPIREISLVVFPEAQWKGMDRDALVNGALGLTSRQALRAFHRVRIEWQRALRRNEPFNPEAAILAEKRRLVQAVDVIEFVDADTNIDEVGGLDELKQWLVSRREAFGERARSFGLPVPKGLLMLGVQGCGKSLMAKVVANFWGLPLLRLDVSTVFGGATPPDAAMRTAIRTAEALNPSVLWVDELEKLFDASSGDGASRLLGSLLTWLQEKSSPVFFVATANRVDHLPPELMRKGRFDEIFFVDLPDRRARQQILAIHLAKHGRAADAFNLHELSERTRNFSGAELEQLVVSGLYEAFGRGGDLSERDLELAIRRTVPLFKTYQEEIKALREWAQERARFASRDSSLLDYFEPRS